MKASTPRTSRLAAVANTRRRQRKERLSSGSPMSAQSPMSKNSPLASERPMTRQSPMTKKSVLSDEQTSIELSASSGSTTIITSGSNIENQENINQVNTIRTLPTDDESISTWSQAQSTVSGFTDDSFGFVSSPKPNKMPSTILSRSRKPTNISIITEEVLSPQNILSPQDSSNVTFRNVASPNRGVFSPRTPKRSGAGFSEENPRSMMKRIDELTQERDRLRLDSNLFKRKLQEALESKSVVIQEKDDQIAELMKSIGNLTVLIDEADESHSKEMCDARTESKSNSKTIKEMEQELSSTVCQLNKLRGSYEMLKQANATGTSLMEQKIHSSAVKAENTVKKLEEELLQAISERDELEGKFDECMDELGRIRVQEQVNQTTIKHQTATIDQLKKQIQGKVELESNFDECVEELGRVQCEEEKHHATIQRQTVTIESLKKQLETSMAKCKADLAQKEEKITEILDEKFEMETALQERIYSLEGQLKSISNGHKEEKHNDESVIKKLKEQLNIANESSEEMKASLVKGMEEMKQGYTESVDIYKKKIADLESKLAHATKEAESAKKELLDAKSMFVTRLEECNRERNNAVSKLDQMTKDSENAKAARGKDINLLEAELDKAYASKLETDKQLQDTRRQLHNALHSLDEMAADGGKMRTDLEGIMNHFHTEKDAIHRELVELRYLTEDQKITIHHLNLEKGRCEQSCDELRCRIRELEGISKGRHSGSSEENDMLKLEIKYLKNKLEKANFVTGPTYTNRFMKPENDDALIDELRASEQLKSVELSKAKQTIQKLKTKEKYLESRVESLANQITKTVQEYETRLGEARELGRG